MLCTVYKVSRKFSYYRIVADLPAGVYYQKCYDPDCRRIDYRSQSNFVTDYQLSS